MKEGYGRQQTYDLCGTDRKYYSLNTWAESNSGFRTCQDLWDSDFPAQRGGKAQ